MVPFRNTELYIDSGLKMIPAYNDDWIPSWLKKPRKYQRYFYYAEIIYLAYVIQ